METYKKLTENSINFCGDIIINSKEEIVAWVHESGNVEFTLSESEDGEMAEFVIHKNNLKKILKLIR